MSIKMDTAGFSAGVQKQRQAFTAATRPAAQAGAEHIYILARLHCPVSDAAHFFYGKNSKKTGVRYHFEAGNLRDSIYQVFSKENSTDTRATYHISWNHTKAPYGWMVENGTSRAAAHPFMAPAIINGRDMALITMAGELRERLGT